MVRDDPKFAYADPYCMVATWRSIVMPVMGSAPVPAQSARAQVRALEAHGKATGRGRVLEITIIAPDSALPSAETRDVFDAGVPIVSPYYGCVTAIFEGTGFRASFIRGMITSFQMLSRNKFPQKVFSSIDDCAKWMHPHAKALGMPCTSAEEIAIAAELVRDAAIERGVFGPKAALTVGPTLHHP